MTKDFENLPRRAFTPGWDDSINSSFGLPIKQGDKIIQVKRLITAKQSQFDEGDDAENELEKSHNDFNDLDRLDSEFEDFNANNSMKSKHNNSKSTKVQTIASSSSLVSNKTFQAIKIKIAEICTAACADPQTCLKRKLAPEELSEGDPGYRILDLFEYIVHTDHRIVQISLLSTLLVFKDIIPGYVIRNTSAKKSDTSGSVQLKKETKRIMDYEQSFLRAYQRFIGVLSEMINRGLGSSKLSVPLSNESNTRYANIGYLALKCQCELLRCAPHFNLRSLLITSVVARSIQPTASVSELACGTLSKVVDADVEGEVSYEIVRAIAQALIAVKHDAPITVLTVLDRVKIRVHEDEARSLRKQAKKERRKRRRDEDDIEARLLEAEGINQTAVKRRQADCLREMCLIYFRILKDKVGFRLLPVALESLARLTHFINMDTVTDLIGVLRRLIDCTAPLAPPAVRLHCVYCALRTLAGPGQELEVDSESFVSALGGLLRELDPSDRWDLALECVHLCLVDRRESRKHHVIDIVSALLHCPCVLDPVAGAATLSLAHSVLVHYPVMRNEILISLNNLSSTKKNDLGQSVREEETVEDLAMAGLFKKGRNQYECSNNFENHIFWATSLYAHSLEPRYAELIRALVGNNIIPVVFNANDAKPPDSAIMAQRLDDCLAGLDAAIGKASKSVLMKKSSHQQRKDCNEILTHIKPQKQGVIVSKDVKLAPVESPYMKSDYRKRKTNRPVIDRRLIARKDSPQSNRKGHSDNTGSTLKRFSKHDSPYTSQNSRFNGKGKSFSKAVKNKRSTK